MENGNDNPLRVDVPQSFRIDSHVVCWRVLCLVVGDEDYEAFKAFDKLILRSHDKLLVVWTIELGSAHHTHKTV